MANPFLYIYNTVLFQTIQLSISSQFQYQKIVLFQTIRLSISTHTPIDRTLSGATTPGQSGPGSDGNEGVLRILQSSSITGTSPSDCLVSYAGHLLVFFTPLLKSSRCILQPQPSGQELDRRVWREYPKSENELFQCLKNAWEGLPFYFFQKMFERMPRICKTLIKAGGCFDYKNKIWCCSMVLFHVTIFCFIFCQNKTK